MNVNETFNSSDDELGSWHIKRRKQTKISFCKLTEKLEKRLNEHKECEEENEKGKTCYFLAMFEEIIRHNGCFGPLLSEIKVESKMHWRSPSKAKGTQTFFNAI